MMSIVFLTGVWQMQVNECIDMPPRYTDSFVPCEAISPWFGSLQPCKALPKSMVRNLWDTYSFHHHTLPAIHVHPLLTTQLPAGSAPNKGAADPPRQTF